MSPIKVLLCAANPEVKSLQLAAEQREIEERVERAERQIQKQAPQRMLCGFDFAMLGSTRSRDLLRLLQLHRPQVLHFSGHGTKSGALLLDSSAPAVTEDRSRVVVGKSILCNLIREFSSDLRLVFLNACYSLTEALPLLHHVDCVIAMDGTIEDPAALTLAATFYEQCALGCSVARAFRLAQAELALLFAGSSAGQTPQLLVRNGADAESIVLSSATQSLPVCHSSVMEMRKLLAQRIPFDPSLHAFLLSFYPSIARQCGSDMQRTVKLNLLFSVERDMNRLCERIDAFCSGTTDD